MSTAEKNPRRSRHNHKRDAERLAAFLATKCFVCHTPSETPSRSLPCCSVLIHEGCLLDTFHQVPHCFHCGGELFKCPKCHAMLLPLNGDEEPPAMIPEGYHVLKFEHVRYERESGSSQAATSSQWSASGLKNASICFTLVRAFSENLAIIIKTLLNLLIWFLLGNIGIVLILQLSVQFINLQRKNSTKMSPLRPSR